MTDMLGLESHQYRDTILSCMEEKGGEAHYDDFREGIINRFGLTLENVQKCYSTERSNKHNVLTQYMGREIQKLKKSGKIEHIGKKGWWRLKAKDKNINISDETRFDSGKFTQHKVRDHQSWWAKKVEEKCGGKKCIFPNCDNDVLRGIQATHMDDDAKYGVYNPDRGVMLCAIHHLTQNYAWCWGEGDKIELLKDDGSSFFMDKILPFEGMNKEEILAAVI